jgi:hypothetical protein
MKLKLVVDNGDVIPSPHTEDPPGPITGETPILRVIFACRAMKQTMWDFLADDIGDDEFIDAMLAYLDDEQLIADMDALERLN